ncbi:MAG TPA: hypothetical protein IAB84_03085 [Candidatus Choladousia intestinigallinarum]|nr:hypothetical protein [Candidatus Choladousia intestinigallinarum]
MRNKKRISIFLAASAMTAGILAGCQRSENSPGNFADIMEAVDELSQAEQLLQIMETDTEGEANE